MHCKFKFVLLVLLAMSGVSLVSTPALAGVDDALEEIGRSIRREVRDRRRDRVAQQIVIVHFFALELGHRHRIRLGRSGLPVTQQLTRILAVVAAAAEGSPSC